MLKSTLGQDVIDVHTLGSGDMLTFDPGFTSTASYESKITFTDGDEGILLHRGFPIDQLATNPNYLEARYILLDSERPTQGQYNEFKTTVTRRITIHKRITHPFHAFRHDSYPTTVMYGITGALAAFYHDLPDVSNPRHREIAASHPLSKTPIVTAMCHKYSIGQPFVYPYSDLSYAGSFLNMMFSVPCEPYGVSPILERVIGHILTLHADHEQNVPASTVYTTGSSGTNPFTYIAAGIASLWGPIHGGTSEAMLKMLEEINSVKHIPEFVRRAKDKNNSFHLMDFDHRAYKNYDPRTIVMRETCREVLRELGTKDDLLEAAMELENIAPNDPHFIEGKLHSSIDLCSGIILKAVGIPFSILTTISTVARTVGWIAHWSEMHSDGMKVTRPRWLCTGYGKRDFKNDVKR